MKMMLLLPGKCVVYHAVLPITGNSKYVMSVALNEVIFISDS